MSLRWDPSASFDAQDDTSSVKFSSERGSGRRRRGFGCGDGADDGAFARRTRLAVVADEKMLDHFVDAGVLEASEFGVLIKRNISRSPDEAQAAEDSACFALEGL